MHSFLPPSGAAAWSQCAMWPTMNAKYPQDDTPESLEGNAAHWVFAEMLECRYHDVGTVTPNGIMVTEEMIEGGELIVDTVARRMPGWLLNVEKPIDIPTVHKDCFGTPDIWGFQNATLEIIDYKFGHRFVDEFENKQGISYIAGILWELSKKLELPYAEIEQCIDVNFTIVQPRCYYKGSSVRTWSTRGSVIKQHLVDLGNSAIAAYDPLPIATTNEECDNCPGSHACAALQLAGYRDSEYAVRSVPIELTPEAAGLELKMMERSLDRLTARVDGMRQQVLTYIRQGHVVTWYRTEQGYGQTKWTVPNEQVISMGQLMGVDLSKLGVKTPNQALKAGVDESVITAYSIKPPGEIKLIQTNPSDARRVFGNN